MTLVFCGQYWRWTRTIVKVFGHWRHDFLPVESPASRRTNHAVRLVTMPRGSSAQNQDNESGSPYSTSTPPRTSDAEYLPPPRNRTPPYVFFNVFRVFTEGKGSPIPILICTHYDQLLASHCRLSVPRLYVRDAVHCGWTMHPIQQYLKKWISTSIYGTRFYNLQPPTPNLSPENLPHLKQYTLLPSGE